MVDNGVVLQLRSLLQQSETFLGRKKIMLLPVRLIARGGTAQYRLYLHHVFGIRPTVQLLLLLLPSDNV